MPTTLRIAVFVMSWVMVRFVVLLWLTVLFTEEDEEM